MGYASPCGCAPPPTHPLRLSGRWWGSGKVQRLQNFFMAADRWDCGLDYNCDKCVWETAEFPPKYFRFVPQKTCTRERRCSQKQRNSKALQLYFSSGSVCSNKNIVISVWQGLKLHLQISSIVMVKSGKIHKRRILHAKEQEFQKCKHVLSQVYFEDNSSL